MPARGISVALIVLCLFVACWGWFDDYGIPEYKADIDPVDSLVFVGETLKLQCRLTDSELQVSPEDMYLEITPHGKNLTWIVPQENVTVANESIHAFVKITEDYSSLTTVGCKCKTLSDQLKSVYIHVEKPIKNITDFSAIYYYNKHLELTWSLGESYLSDDNINVTVAWSANVSPDNGGFTCDVQTKEYCQIRMHGQDIIFVKITVNYVRYDRPSLEFLQPLYGRNATSEVKIFVNNHTKTQPPGNLHVRDINSTCAELNWVDPLYFNSCQCDLRYSVTVTEISNKSNTMTKHGVRPYRQDHITICSFSPFTAYKLSVEIRANEMHPWSEPAVTEATTDEDRPLTGPPLTSTSYSSDECVENKTDVTIYWNDPLKPSLQGELTMFEVLVDNVSALLRRGSNFYKTELDCDVEHKIFVYSATKVGTSLTPSDISIPRKSAELPALNDVTVRMEEVQESSAAARSMNVTVAWDPGLAADRNVTLVLYSCQGASVPYTCLNDFTTTEINVNKAEIRLEDLQASVSLFGYALKDDQGHKRGIQWINCVYRAEQLPKKPDPVNVNAGRTPNTLEISWTSRRCDRETKVLILWYHLSICRQKISQQRDLQLCNYTVVNSSQSKYIARDLTGGSTYYVYIQAESPAGLGPPSNPTSAVPAVASSVRENNLATVMGILSGILLAGVIGSCFVRWCRQSRKKIKSLAGKNENIFRDVKQIHHQPTSESESGKDANLKPTLEVCPDYPLVPPALDGERPVDMIHQFLPEPCPPVGTGNEMAADKTTGKHQSPTFAADMDTSEPKIICIQSVSKALGIGDPLVKDPGDLHSDSANPYVKMTNECFSLGSGSPSVMVDEGYNSPEVEMDSPTFSVDASQTLFTGVSPMPPLCMNGLVPIVSPQSQNVFMCAGVSHFPSQAEKLLPQSDSSIISLQPQILKTDLSMNLPQSQFSKADLSMNLPQSQFSKKDLSINPTQNEISKTNVSQRSSSVILYPHFQSSLNKCQETSTPAEPIATTNSSVIHVYNVASPSPSPSLPPQCELPHTVHFQDSNPLAVTSLDSNSPSVSFFCHKNSPEFNVYYTPETSLPVRPQNGCCHRNTEIPADCAEVYENTENISDLSKDDNSSQQMLSCYVTCALDGVGSFEALDADSEHCSTNSENMSSDYKPNCQTSQNLATKEGSESSGAGYKTLEFLKNSAELDSGGQGSFETSGEDSLNRAGSGTFDENFCLDRFGNLREDSIDQGKFGIIGEDCIGAGRFGAHVTDYVCQGGFVDHSDFVTHTENCGSQNQLSNCVGNKDDSDTYGGDSFVTSAANGDVNFEQVDSPQRGCSDYTPNCQTNICSRDAFLDNKSDNSISESICSNVGQRDTVMANSDDSQHTWTEYRGLGFLENCLGNKHKFGIQEDDHIQQVGFGIPNEDCIRQTGFGIQNEDLGCRGDLLRNENNANEDWLLTENNDGNEVDGQTFEHVRPHLTDKDCNLAVEQLILKPAYIGNIRELLEVSSQETTSLDSSLERDDLDSTSANATFDDSVEHSISDGGYVSQVQLSVLAQPHVSYC